MLEFRNVSKSFGDNIVLDNISFKIDKGEVFAITGKSGCGKSTLLKCINRLENIDGGQILFHNHDISKMDIINLRQKIGLVFQEYNLFEHLTVLENLIIGPKKIKNISEDTAIQNAKEILKKIGLSDKIHNYPDELSGGQKQRVAIARTLLMKPELILLDEPTSALDREMKQEVLNLINELVEEEMTLIIVSHEEEFINKIADRKLDLTSNK